MKKVCRSENVAKDSAANRDQIPDITPLPEPPGPGEKQRYFSIRDWAAIHRELPSRRAWEWLIFSDENFKRACTIKLGKRRLIDARAYESFMALLNQETKKRA